MGYRSPSLSHYEAISNVDNEAVDQMAHRGGRPAGLLRPLLLLYLAGVMLRLTILALPPVIHSIQADFGLRGWDIGVLTAIPSSLFALAAIPGAALIGRFGAVSILITGLLICASGAAARGFTTDVIELEAATALMCLGVAIMQPSMPTLVRMWTPARIGLATATYTSGLLCGEVLPIAWPFAPALPVIGTGWRSVLLVWSLPVFATALAIFLFRPFTRPVQPAPASRTWSNWRDSALWKIAVLLGSVNASYFGLNGFLPDWLSKAGGSAMIQPALLALNAAQIPASLLMMVFVERLAFRRSAYVIAGLAVLAGSVGLATAPPTFAIAIAATTGFFLACLLTMALTLPPLLVAAERVPSFSAAVFTVSYTIAVLTALLTGLLENTDAGQRTSVVPVAAAALAVVALGSTIRRPGAQKSSHERHLHSEDKREAQC